MSILVLVHDRRARNKIKVEKLVEQYARMFEHPIYNIHFIMLIHAKYLYRTDVNELTGSNKWMSGVIGTKLFEKPVSSSLFNQR